VYGLIENDFQLQGSGMTLDELRSGERAKVLAIGGEGVFRRRLLELGLLPGTEIERTGQAPLGDPVSYRVRGAVVCLRRVDARVVSVAPAGAAAPEASRELAAK
jgi:ferrous iron transport protein A